MLTKNMIKLLRKLHSQSQKELADFLDIPQQKYSSYESGKSSIPEEVSDELSVKWGLDVLDIMEVPFYGKLAPKVLAISTKKNAKMRVTDLVNLPPLKALYFYHWTLPRYVSPLKLRFKKKRNKSYLETKSPRCIDVFRGSGICGTCANVIFEALKNTYFVVTNCGIHRHDTDYAQKKERR